MHVNVGRSKLRFPGAQAVLDSEKGRPTGYARSLAILSLGPLFAAAACSDDAVGVVPQGAPDAALSADASMTHTADASGHEPTTDSGGVTDAATQPEASVAMTPPDSAVSAADAGHMTAPDVGVDRMDAAVATSTSAPASSSSIPDSGLTTDVDSSITDSSVPSVDSVTPGDGVFGDEQVLSIYITTSDAVHTSLEEHGNLEQYLSASVRIGGAGFTTSTFEEVGVRHKGAWSLHHCWDDNGGVRNYEAECAKLSYKLKFDEYVDGTTFRGLSRLNLHASAGDPTKLRELLAYSTFRDFGVDAPRTAIARVVFNGELQGVFIAVEEIDDRYVAARFPDAADGNLYKEIWPASGLPDDHFTAALETNRDESNVSDMQSFAGSVAAATPETFETEIGRWVNIDQVVRYIAVDRALKNWDGVMALYSPVTPHNFFWYHDSGEEDRFHLIPWDLDNTFGTYDPYMAPEESGWISAAAVPNWNVEPAHCDPRPVWDIYGSTTIVAPRCDPFLDLLAETQWETFATTAGSLLATTLSSPVTDAKLDAWTATLEPLIAEDPSLDAALSAFEQAQLRFTLEDIRADFSEFVASGLSEEYIPVLRPTPTEYELAEPSNASGLELDKVNNFEFVDLVEGDELPAASYAVAYYSTADVSWNTTLPLAGSADARFDFTYNRVEGAYNEWSDLNLGMQQGEVDLRDYTQVVVTLTTDQPRNVRVRLTSPVYGDDFGGAWEEFGNDLWVTEYPQVFVLPLRQMSYASWARDAWQTGQGWSGSDTAAREKVLARTNGLRFGPGAVVDYYGELLNPVDTGFLQVDTLYFQ